ncbi:MAG: hypothetical protein VW438_00800, partial [Euryarchaeota archaeon]
MIIRTSKLNNSLAKDQQKSSRFQNHPESVDSVKNELIIENIDERGLVGVLMAGAYDLLADIRTNSGNVRTVGLEDS